MLHVGDRSAQRAAAERGHCAAGVACWGAQQQEPRTFKAQGRTFVAADAFLSAAMSRCLIPRQNTYIAATTAAPMPSPMMSPPHQGNLAFTANWQPFIGHPCRRPAFTGSWRVAFLNNDCPVSYHAVGVWCSAAVRLVVCVGAYRGMRCGAPREAPFGARQFLDMERTRIDGVTWLAAVTDGIGIGRHERHIPAREQDHTLFLALAFTEFVSCRIRNCGARHTPTPSPPLN